ncbi:nucleotidyltransferase family protein [Muricauda oceani]|uniref:NTP transferase domain-containing protein n=1 Tax=Flagellimonas oceani TaxID=2698672 RepID=A0A6G7J775_9FLAO|nr:nucleotidyltransferase family protein [Allomuricauda oceani]MBW8242638.1 nucleotidyltransferase family protein [Allomuricauda oceani]QII46394.1 NTP transferase domain-containing protein [Allomuricauda oceani]
MRSYRNHLILSGSRIRQALIKLDELASDAILFVIDENNKLKGSLTDGDIRRGLIKGISIEDEVDSVIQPNPRYVVKGEQNIKEIIEYREKNFRIIPVLNGEGTIVNIINFRNIRSYLPVDAVIMAGGRGSRLRPLTDTVPKPLLKVGDKPIVEHNLDRLALYGIDDFWISVKYLGEQIKDYFGDGHKRNVKVKYVWEDRPMGTIGAVSKITDFEHEYVLLTNSDILTNLDYEDFFLDFLNKDADLSVVTIPYMVDIPYGVLETSNGHVINLREKPTYTYYSNGGIYLIKKSVLSYLPKNEFFNATDLMETLLKEKRRVISYPLSGYWLDIGKHEDFKKAQQDIKQIKF